MDRNKALELGITENQVASRLLTTLAGNQLIQPTFWLDTHNGVNYSVISQAPEHLVNSVAALGNIPLSTPGVSGLNGNSPQLLSNVATISHSVDPAVVEHYTIQRVIDVNCAVAGRDLGRKFDAGPYPRQLRSNRAVAHRVRTLWPRERRLGYRGFLGPAPSPRHICERASPGPSVLHQRDYINEQAPKEYNDDSRYTNPAGLNLIVR